MSERAKLRQTLLARANGLRRELSTPILRSKHLQQAIFRLRQGNAVTAGELVAAGFSARGGTQ